MSKETKFGYGSLLAGIGLPFLIEKYGGENWAVLVALVCTGAGIALLISDYFHKEKGERLETSEQRARAFLYVALLSVMAFSVVRYISSRRKEATATPDEQTQGKDNNEQLNGMLTGGDSYCYFTADIHDGTPRMLVRFDVYQAGKFPLRSVSANISDNNEMNHGFLYGNQQEMDESNRNISIGDLAIGAARGIATYNIRSADKFGFDIMFDGLNGRWFEMIRAQKINGKWSQARKLTFTDRPKNKDIETTDSDYPTLDGKVEWNSPITRDDYPR